MGCDIHIEAEKLSRETGVWEAIPVPDHLLDDYDRKWKAADDGWDPEWVSCRNYSLFAMFANVRNGHGFAGISTGTGFKPIAMPRGLPDDISATMRKKAYGDEDPKWGLDGHTPSWLSLRELMEYPVKDLRTKRRGCLKLEDLRAWRKTQSTQPPSWCGWAAGHNVHHVTPEVLEEHLINPPAETKASNGMLDTYYAEYEWETTYHECCPYFFDVRLPALVEIAGDDIDGVRLVFFFDN